MQRAFLDCSGLMQVDNWVIPKKIRSPPQRKFPHLGREEGNCLKNVLNLYRMSGGGVGYC